MSLYGFVVKLRKKPERKKKQMLVFLLAISFVVLVVFWVMLFKGEFAQVSDSGKNSGELTQYGDNVLSPLAALVAGFKNLKNDLSAKTGDLLNSYSNIKNNNVKKRPVYELPVE